MSTYRGYDSGAGNKAAQKYKKEKQHRVEVAWKNDEFMEHIAPAIEKSGLPVASYIKQAVEEKIQRDENNDVEKK